MDTSLAQAVPTVAKPTRAQIAFWLLGTAIFLGVALWSFGSFQLGVYQDDASYVVLAQSLASGAPYGMLNAAYTPAPAPFPFGYPLLLAPLAYFFPAQPELMRWLSFAATLLSGALLFWQWRTFSPGTSYWWGASVSTLYLLSPLTVAHSQMVMSEAVFTSFVLGAMVVVSRLRLEKIRYAQLTLASILLVFVVFIRTIGITLVTAILLDWLIRYRQRALLPLLALGVSMLIVIGIIVAVTAVEPTDLLPGRYLRELATGAQRPRLVASNKPKPSLLFNLDSYFTFEIKSTVFPLGNGGTALNFVSRLGLPWLLRALGLSVSLVCALGLWQWYRTDGMRLPLLFGVVYLLTVLVWTWSLPRLLYPIQPHIFFTFLFGLAALAAFLTKRIPIAPLVKYAAAALLVLALSGMAVAATARGGSTQAHVGDLSLRTAWLRAHTPPDSVVVSQYPQIDYVYGARKTLRFQDLNGAPPQTLVLIAPRIDWTPETASSDGVSLRIIHTEMQARTQAHTAALLYQDTSHEIYVYQLTP